MYLYHHDGVLIITGMPLNGQSKVFAPSDINCHHFFITTLIDKEGLKGDVSFKFLSRVLCPRMLLRVYIFIESFNFCIY